MESSPSSRFLGSTAELSDDAERRPRTARPLRPPEGGPIKSIYSRSTNIAMPWPPATHIDSMP